MAAFSFLTSLFFAVLVSSQQSTQVVTATTTVTATASGEGACNNFYGACVVYGTAGAAPYTVTVWETSIPATTATQTVYISAGASGDAASSACNNFQGACVVYATGGTGGAQYTSTVYSGGTQSNSDCPGSSDGCIGLYQGNSGYIGAATRPGWLQTGPEAISFAIYLGLVLWL